MNNLSLVHASRPQTPTSYLSGLTWEQGPTAFFTQGVPFSYGVGPTLARRIWAAYRAVYTQDAVSGLEIGAGLGYLSKHSLDIAGSEIVQWHVSDASTALVNHWQQAQTFSSYSQAVLRSLTLDVPFVWSGALDLIVMSYVLDSTSTCHLEWENGVLYEWVMTTAIADSPIVAVSTEVPLSIVKVSAKHVWDNWECYADTDKPWLAPRLSGACQETWERIPATQSGCLLSEDLSLLATFLQDSGLQHMIFNYPLMLRERLPELMASLSDRGMIALHDFGYQSLSGAVKPEDLCTSFGTIQAYPLCFPLVTWMASQSGMYGHISPAPEGESALCLISKCPLPETWVAADACYVQAHTLQTQVHDLMQLPTPATAVPWADHDDYTLMAHRAMSATSTTDRGFWLQTAIAHYPDLAIPSYAQYAQLLVEKGDRLAAIDLLEAALVRFPLDPTLALSLGNLYVREKAFSSAMAVFQGSLRRLDDPLVWQVLKLMTLLPQE